MKKIREGSFPQKGAFVQYKQKARLSLACISTTLSWDLLKFAYTAMVISTQKQKGSCFGQETKSCKFPSRYIFFFLISLFLFSVFLVKADLLIYTVVALQLNFFFCSQENSYCPIENMPFCPLFA